MLTNFELNRILVCPNCGGELNENHDNLDGLLNCSSCNNSYDIYHNIPILLDSNNFKNDMNYIEHYEKDAELFNYFEQRDCKATEHDERRLREYILSKKPKNSKLILDVGSGSSWLSRSTDFNENILISFDLSKKNVLQTLKNNPNVNHYGVVGDALKPPFKENTFDCIIASEVIEHLVEPKEFIYKMRAILKPGGTLLISTPYKEVIPNYLCIHCNQMTPKNAHLHSFDEEKLKELFNKNDNHHNYYLKYFIFGNKALTILRTHVFLKYLPFKLWKIIDQLCNFMIKKQAHIIVVFRKNLSI